MTRIHLVHLDPWTCGQSQTLALAAGLRDAGLDARLVCRHGSPLHRAAVRRSLPVHTLPPHGVTALPVLWAFFRALRGAPKGAGKSTIKGNACLVHACDTDASRLVAFAARLKKNLCLFHTRRISCSDPDYAKITRCQTPPATVIVESATLREEGPQGENTHVIPCGLDPATCTVHTPRNDGRFVVAVTGNLTKGKGHTDFFDALVQLAAKNDMPPWEARMLGQGPLFHQLFDLTQAKGIAGRMAFLGGQNSRRQLSACDVLALPASSGESCMPLILQGWACGVPVVAVERPEYTDCLQPGVNCLTVPAAAPRAMADTLALLAHDATLRARLSQGGFAALARFPLSAMVQAHLALYKASGKSGALPRTPQEP